MANSSRVRAVSAFLRNPEGKVISQLRDDKPGLVFPACWSTLGGQVNEDETPDEAMCRELIEEIEFCPPLTFWRIFNHHFWLDGRRLETDIYAYIGDVDVDIADIRLHEGQRLAFLTSADVDTLSFAYGLNELFREYFAAHEHRTGNHL